LRKADAVRNGSDTLEVKNTGGDTQDLAETLDGLADLDTSPQANGLAAFAKLVRNSGSTEGAKASPKDRRKFGLDTLAWDLKDLAVEEAEERGGSFGAEDVKTAKIDRERFMWWLVQGTSMDAVATSAGRELLEAARSSGGSRRFREKCMLQLFEGFTRAVKKLASGLKSVTGGSALLELAAQCEENARYAQERVQWVEQDDYTWDQIEQSERQRLRQDILRKCKSSKVLTRQKLQQLMRDARLDYLRGLKKPGASNKGSAKCISNLRKEVSNLQTALGKRKRPALSPPGKALTSKRGDRGGSNKPYCKWCKRAERHHLIHHHNSQDCKHKPKNG